MLELKNIKKYYKMGDNVVKALDGINLKIEDGEFVTIIGPSGSGKSTMMNIVGCLDVATEGEYFVDGVERDMIHVILAPAVYGELRNYLDKSSSANVNTGIGEMGTFHGVKVYSSVYLPEKCTMVAMADGAIAQPVTTDLDEADKYPASNCYHFGMFYSYGTKAVAPDVIQVVKTA